MSENVVENAEIEDRVGERDAEPSVIERKRERTPAGERFDYSQVPPEVAKHARDTARIYHVTLKRTARDILEVGRMLIQVKESLKHGLWMKWRDAELGLSHHTATDWMNYARTFSGVEEMVEHLSVSSLKPLARVSEPVRQTVLAKAQKGEVRTKSNVERAIAGEEVGSELPKSPQSRSLKKEIAGIRRRCFSSDFALLAEAIKRLSKAASVVAARQETIDRSDAEHDVASLAAGADTVLQQLYVITGVIFDSEEGQKRRLTGLSKELGDVLGKLAAIDSPESKCASESSLLASHATRLAELAA